jgi:hypothetical protein
VSIQGETLFWKGRELHSTLAVKMIDMLKEGFPIEPMVNFMENLYQNPSKRAVDELYGFLEKGNLPITPDGHFLAYKKVRDNYFDCHSGTMDNSVGQVVEMERFDVDDNKDNTCSTGLHFCSKEYLASFGGARTMIVKINPRDVVSIPSDYNASKGRACRYEVIGELNVSEDQAFTRPVQATANRPVKEGSSPFYKGYSDGWNDSDYHESRLWTNKERNDYTEGFDKGIMDKQNGIERYRYIAPTIVSNANSGAWPFPNK